MYIQHTHIVQFYFSREIHICECICMPFGHAARYHHYKLSGKRHKFYFMTTNWRLKFYLCARVAFFPLLSCISFFVFFFFTSVLFRLFFLFSVVEWFNSLDCRMFSYSFLSIFLIIFRDIFLLLLFVVLFFLFYLTFFSISCRLHLLVGYCFMYAFGTFFCLLNDFHHIHACRLNSILWLLSICSTAVKCHHKRFFLLLLEYLLWSVQNVGRLFRFFLFFVSFSAFVVHKPTFAFANHFIYERAIMSNKGRTWKAFDSFFLLWSSAPIEEK